MIKRLYRYHRQEGLYSRDTSHYWGIEFDDDQSYYRAVTYMRDKHGRAGSRRERNPSWVYNPDALFIGVRWNVYITDLLKSRHGWQEIIIYTDGRAPSDKVSEWCTPRNYIYWTTSQSIGICAPTEKDLLMARLRFSDYAASEPSF